MKKMVQGMAEARRDQGARVVEGEQMLQLLQLLRNHHYYFLLQSQNVPSLSEVALVLEQPLQGERDVEIVDNQTLKFHFHYCCCSSC